MEEERITRIENMQVNVARVKLTGLKRTKADIVTEQVKSILKATTLQEVFTECLQAVDKLHELNIFKTIGIELDTNKANGKVKGIDVIFNVKESGLISASVSGNAGTQTGDANIDFGLKNIFGRAEQLRAGSTTAFPNWGQTYSLEFAKPYYKDIDKKLKISLGSTNNKQPVSGYQEHIAGQKVQLEWLSQLGHHTLGWVCDWRQLFGFDTSVPMEIRKDAGHSLKSSIKHVLETDQRDDPLLPSNGYHSKLSQEVAGLGGDVFFSKSEVQTEVYKEIFSDCVLGLSAWGGYLKAFSPSKINDRFLLGGPTTLRGFETWGVGPKRQGYSYGGEAYWALGLHLFTPIPYTSGELFRRIRLHGFMTAGNLTEIGSLSELSNLVKGSRLSGGVGLHCRLGFAQIELNYAFPLLAQSHDTVKPGLQFGVGLDML